MRRRRRWRCVHARCIIADRGGAARRGTLAPRRAQVRYGRVIILEVWYHPRRHHRPVVHRAHLHFGTSTTGTLSTQETRVNQLEAVLSVGKFKIIVKPQNHTSYFIRTSKPESHFFFQHRSQKYKIPRSFVIASRAKKFFFFICFWLFFFFFKNFQRAKMTPT